MRHDSERAERFTRAYAAIYTDLLRFVQRRVETGAEDVVAEAMTVAWRRVDDLPAPLDDARAWMFGITHHCLLNHRRSGRRREALGVRMATVGPAEEAAPDGADLSAIRLDLARAWHLLDPGTRRSSRSRPWTA
ncbi:RNA polymerase sigma factor [Arsenicicoccus sp. oral taxon 190]|uniref:RNA polymerase sigma factor n=1 Tax=Arsenicicoccus sp. oral taxon 190 TaxID=1658671 RepID=UPI0020A157A8|nr:sigma factor [Arsenicicoccus sp. oral taxon 190]